MGEKINSQRCIIIAAAPYDEADLNFIKKEIDLNDFIICADGGFEKAFKISVVPNLIIGDLDSNKIIIPDKIKTIKLPVKKDDTDTMICIKKAIELNFKEIVILGAIKGRIDHAMANISILLYAKKQGINICLKDDQTEIYVVLSDQRFFINNKKDYTVSIFPFGVSSIKVSLKGFEYPLNDQRVYIDNPIGISNHIVESEAFVFVIEGTAIVLLIKNE